MLIGCRRKDLQFPQQPTITHDRIDLRFGQSVQPKRLALGTEQRFQLVLRVFPFKQTRPGDRTAFSGIGQSQNLTTFDIQFADRLQELRLSQHEVFMSQTNLKQQRTRLDGFTLHRMHVHNHAGHGRRDLQPSATRTLSHQSRHGDAAAIRRQFDRLNELRSQPEIPQRFLGKFERLRIVVPMIVVFVPIFTGLRRLVAVRRCGATT